MRRYTKMSLRCLLVLALLISLTACGNNKKEVKKKVSTSTPAVEAVDKEDENIENNEDAEIEVDNSSDEIEPDNADINSNFYEESNDYDSEILMDDGGFE